MTPAEIRSTLKKLRKAKTVKELATAKFREQMERLQDTTNQFDKLPEDSELINAFLKGDSTAALQRLVELRSGSASDQSSSAAKVVEIDIEDAEHNFSWVYRYFCSSVLNAVDETLCGHLLSGKAIEFLVRELKSASFRRYRGKSPSKSQTAAAISIQMNIITNISNKVSLQSELRRELEKAEYFPVLKFYVTDRSVPVSPLPSLSLLLFLLLLYFHFLFRISDFHFPEVYLV